jgi:MoaA/NifB/PqqE/SkfB family radical SAM enzyme
MVNNSAEHGFTGSPEGLLDKSRFLVHAIKSPAAVWSDFVFKTNFSKPHMVLIEPTLRCPMACKFCDLPTDPTYPKSTELPITRWQEILAELRDFSPLIRSVYISGGEPFLRRDLIDLIEHAHRMGMGTRTLTIGQFCDRRLLDRLLASPMEVLKFSLHSSRAEIHNRLVGREIFDKTIGAIRYLKANNYRGKLGILCTVFSDNVGHLGDVARLGSDLGLDYMLFRPLFGQTIAHRDPDRLRSVYAKPRADLAVEDLELLRRSIEELRELRNQGLPIANSDKALDAITGRAEGTFEGVRGCHLMYESMYIKPNGDIDACGHMALGTMGNVASASVSSVLGSQAAYDVRHSVTRKCRCNGNIFVRQPFRERASLALALLRD